MKLKLLTTSLFAVALYTGAAVADHGPTTVGGASMLPSAISSKMRLIRVTIKR